MSLTDDELRDIAAAHLGKQTTMATDLLAARKALAERETTSAARDVLAERERCAMIVQAVAEDDGEFAARGFRTGEEQARRGSARAILALIRLPAPPVKETSDAS